MDKRIEEARRKLQEANDHLEKMILDTISDCPHTVAAEVGPFDSDEPHRMCLNCGLVEGGWGIGYKILYNSLIDPKVTPSDCRKLYTKRLNAIQKSYCGFKNPLSPMFLRSNSMELDKPRQGKYDRLIEVWSQEHNQWLPTWFSYLQAGQFFLDPIMGQMEDSKCYLCTRGVITTRYRGELSFTIQGIEIVRKPESPQTNALTYKDDSLTIEGSVRLLEE